MFSNPLFENSRNDLNESLDTHTENFSFKPAQGEVLLEQARTSINNLMLKFEKPKKGEKFDKKDDEEDDFKLLSESFMINLDKLNASQINMKPIDIDFNMNKIQESKQKNSNIHFKNSSLQRVSPSTAQDISIANPIDLLKKEAPNQKYTEFSTAVRFENSSLDIKIQNLESEKKLLEDSLEKLQEDHNHLIHENEGLQKRIRDIETEKSQIYQKNMEDLAHIQSLTHQIQTFQDQTSLNCQEFLLKKEALTQQYEKQIEELKNTIRLNEDLLRKSVNKETLYEALQVQMENLQKSNQSLQMQFSEVLNMLENSKVKFIEKETSLMGIIESLKNEIESFKKREEKILEESRKYQEIQEFFEETQLKNQFKIKEYEQILERKEEELLHYKKNEIDYKNSKQSFEQNFHELHEKYYENEENLLRYKMENQTLEGINKELKKNIETLSDQLQIVHKKFEDFQGEIVDREARYRDKYLKLEEIYKNSKAIIENYSKQFDDYKMEKELLIKQLLEEKSRNQQERMSFTDQKRMYEESLRKHEEGIQKQEFKIKDLINDLLQKESFIRNSVSDKNIEFERIKQEYFRLLENKEKDIQDMKLKIDELLKVKEDFSLKTKDWNQVTMEKNALIRSFERKCNDYEMKFAKIQEENNRILNETKEMQIHKTLLLENKVHHLQEKLERFVKPETDLRKTELDGISFNAQRSTTKTLNPFIKTVSEKKDSVQSERKQLGYDHLSSLEKDALHGEEMKNSRIEGGQDIFAIKQTSNFETKSNVSPCSPQKFLEEKIQIFLKKDIIKEEIIFAEASTLKKEVLEALQSYQKLITAIQLKKISTNNLKRYIGDNLQNIFINYSKILFVYFKPNENFVSLLNLNLYFERPDEIKRKIFSKNQYVAFKNIHLRTGGTKEKEINEIMENCNDFIIEFYEFIKRTTKRKIHPNRITEKSTRGSAHELYCPKCNGVYPFEIYKSHTNTCGLYGTGKMYEEDILSKNISVETRNKSFSIKKICDLMNSKINEVQIETRKQIISLISNLRNLKFGDHNEHLIIKVKELRNQNLKNSFLNVCLDRVFIILEDRKGDELFSKESCKLENIQSD